MKITFTQPVTVGSLTNRISLSSLQLKSVSFNLAGPKGAPNVLVSVVLTDPTSGYDQYFEYEDSATAAFFTQVEGLQVNGVPWIAALLQRLQGDGLLPTGSIA